VTDIITKLRIWILLAAMVMTGLAIDRTVQAHGLHGIGEGILAAILWFTAGAGFVNHSAAETRSST
jgi:hypothetical protein